MIFGRKSAFWGPESIQKPYIDHPTQYGVIFWKVKKNRFFDPQNHDKIFFKVDFFGRWSPATKSILGIDTSYWCPQDPIILLYWPHPFLPKSSVKIPKYSKKRLFPRKCCFCCFCCLCCVLGVANVVFQNLPNLEIFLAIFIFSIRRLVKKLFDFEVMFRSGGLF